MKKILFVAVHQYHGRICSKSVFVQSGGTIFDYVCQSRRSIQSNASRGIGRRILSPNVRSAQCCSGSFLLCQRHSIVSDLHNGSVSKCQELRYDLANASDFMQIMGIICSISLQVHWKRFLWILARMVPSRDRRRHGTRYEIVEFPTECRDVRLSCALASVNRTWSPDAGVDWKWKSFIQCSTLWSLKWVLFCRVNITYCW